MTVFVEYSGQFLKDFFRNWNWALVKNNPNLFPYNLEKKNPNDFSKNFENLKTILAEVSSFGINAMISKKDRIWQWPTFYTSLFVEKSLENSCSYQYLNIYKTTYIQKPKMSAIYLLTTMLCRYKSYVNLTNKNQIQCWKKAMRITVKSKILKI